MIVLALAPEVAGLPRLASTEELTRIGDVPAVQLRMVLDVTRQRIIDRMERERPDALLWVGHGRLGELLIEGDVIEPQWLATQMRNYGVGLAVLATCESDMRPDAPAALGFADVLPAAGIDTITMATRVSDRAALEYDVALFQALAGGSALRQAHGVGVATAQRFGGVQAPQLTPADGGMGKRTTRMTTNDDATGYRLANSEALLKRMDSKMDQVIADQNDMRVEMQVQKTTIAGLVQDVASLRQEVANLRATAPEVRREWLIGTAVMLFVMLVVLLVLTVRLM